MEKVTSTLAKITQPKFPGAFLRKRLFRQLDRSCKKPIIWICGPPGAGKTILAGSYLDARNHPSIWYQIDERDAELSTFFYYMGLAVKNASTSRKRPLPLLTPEYLTGLSQFTLSYFEDLYGRLKEGTFLILENYHHIPDDSPFHEVILKGMETIPEGIHVIVVSRTRPPAGMTRLLAGDSIEILDWDALRLTSEESHGIIRAKVKEKISRKVSDALHDKSNGWPAGLVLMVEALIKRGIDAGALEGVQLNEIFYYLSSEILLKTDREVQDLLLKTSLFPSMDPLMAERLTGIANADNIFSRLVRDNYFIERHSHINPVYQYHPLFREFLLCRAKESYTSAEVTSLMQKAAVILEEAGRAEDAFVLFRDSGDWEGVVQLVMRQAQSLISQGRNRVLEDWINSLPEELLQDLPWVQYWLGVSQSPFNPVQACRNMEIALQSFRSAKDPVGAYLAWSGFVVAKTNMATGLADLDRWIELLDSLNADFRGYPSVEIEAIVASSMIIALTWRYPGQQNFDYWLEKVFRLHDIIDPMLRINTLVSLSIAKQVSSDFPGGKAFIDKLILVAKSNQASPLSVLMGYWQESVHFTLAGNLDWCMEAVQKGMRLAESSGVRIMDMMLLGHGALSSYNSGDFKTGDRLLGEMEVYFNCSRPLDQCFYYFNKAQRAILKHEFSAALALSDFATDLASEVGFPMVSSFVAIQKALILKRLKRDEDARYHLRHGYMAVERGYIYCEFLCLIMESFFAFEAEENVAGIEFLRKALDLIKGCGFIPLYIWFPDVMEKICMQALDAGIEVDLIQGLIRERHIVPEAPPLDIENWPWPVKVYTLGRFELVINGKPVQFSRKAQQRPLDLLMALIALGGRDVREDELTDALWPESDGDTAHKAFATTLFRLRQLIKCEKAITLIEGKLTIDPRYCYVDAWAFERALMSAAKETRSGRHSEISIWMTERGLGIYQGRFLHGDGDKPWAVSMRERLKNKFSIHTGEVGKFYVERGDMKQAITFFKKGIEVDPYTEEFYQHLMTSYQTLGRKAEALATYNHLKNLLLATFGVEPSPKTMSIYRSLTGR